tara:strand:+ start:984 stop:1259 length:276 start_codon:yes stop_codon:yes gene_type:complete
MGTLPVEVNEAVLTESFGGTDGLGTAPSTCRSFIALYIVYATFPKHAKDAGNVYAGLVGHIVGVQAPDARDYVVDPVEISVFVRLAVIAHL